MFAVNQLREAHSLVFSQGSRMLGTLGIVQLRCGQFDHGLQMAQGFLLRSWAGKTMLEWIVRRVTEAQRLDGVIVLTRPDDDHQQLASHVPADVPVLASNARDALAACIEAIEKYPCRSVVLVDTQSPFVDPALIDRLVSTAAANPLCDYISYCLSDGQPTVRSEMGIFAQWCSSHALRRADRRALADDRLQATHYIYSHPELFQLRLLPAPAQLDRDDVRLRITCEEDWDHAVAILEALGPDALEWQAIASLLDEQPALRQRMAVLNQADG
jgi:spore coat polysaccharide biosynthesis protein SpsF